MRNLLIVLFLICGTAQADFFYQEEIAVGGGVDDADGGSELRSNGDIRLSGELLGDNFLVLNYLDSGSPSAEGALTLGPGPGLGTQALFSFFSDSYFLGTPAKEFFAGYFENIFISNEATIGLLNASTIQSDGFSILTSSGSVVPIIDLGVQSLPGPFDPDNAYALVGAKSLGSSIFNFFVNVNDSVDGVPTTSQTPELEVASDGITANVVINAEGGIKVGGVFQIAPGDTVVKEGVDSTLEPGVTINASAAGSNFTDDSVRDSLTIGSGGDLSSPPAIGGTAPAAGSFTGVTSPSLETTEDILDILTDGAGTNLEYRIGFGKTGTTTNVFSFYNNITEKVSIDLISGDITSEGEVEGLSLRGESIDIIDPLSTSSGIFLDVGPSTTSDSRFSFGGVSAKVLNRAGGTATIPTIIANSDIISTTSFKGYDGANYITAAYMTAEIDSAPGTDDMPGVIKFFITPDGSDTAIESLVIQDDLVLAKRDFEIGDDETGGTLVTLIGQKATNAPVSIVYESYGESAGVRAVVTDGLSLARHVFRGYNGTDLDRAARMEVIIDGTPGLNDMPGRFVFFTSPDGSDSPALALTIDSSQDLIFEKQLIAGSTVIVNSSEEVLSDALEDTNALVSDTWVAYSEDNPKGQSVTVVESTGSTINFSGTGQTIVVDSFYHNVASAAPNETIQTINGSSFTGQELIIVNSGSFPFSFVHGTGNIDTYGDVTFSMDSGNWAKFFYDGSNWREITHK